MSTITLNQGQQALFDLVTSLDLDSHLFVQAEAGCGKTFTLCHIANYLAEQGFSVLFAAPTHTATGVIENNLGSGSKVEVRTVASMLGQFQFQFQTGERAFARPNAARLMGRYDFIFIDEVSMLGEKEVTTLLSIDANECLLIFSGDPHQLKPVMKKAGNVWDKVTNFKLTQQMRQLNEIHKLAQECRDKATYPTKSTKNIKVHASKEALVSEFIAKIRKADSPTDYMLLAYKNETVDAIAAQVHNELYGSEPFVVGQWLRLERNVGDFKKGSEVLIDEVELDDENFLGFKNYTLLLTDLTGHKMAVINAIPQNQVKKLKNRQEYLVSQAKTALEAKNMDALKAINIEQSALDEHFTPVSSPFARTVHKSQGSTKAYVYVISSELEKASQKKSLTYVAFSRASIKLHTIMPALKIKGITLSEMQKQLKAQLGGAIYWGTVNHLKATVPGFRLLGANKEASRELLIQHLLAH